jgi:hypothetical protein
MVLKLRIRICCEKKLIDYAYKLRLFALLVKVFIVYPKLRILVESSKFVKI